MLKLDPEILIILFQIWKLPTRILKLEGSHRAYSPPLSMSCDGLLIAKIDTTWWAKSYPIKMAHQFFNNLFTDSVINVTIFPFFNFLLRVIIFIWFYSILVSAFLNYLNFTLLPIQVSDLARSNIHQDINWENNNKIWDGWSRLVMIPVSHTGGREFKSLLIHRALNTH